MADFPGGKTDGVSQLLAAEWNQTLGLNNAISSVGQTPSTGDLNQISKTMAQYGSGNFYTDGGAADAYSLSAIGSMQSPDAYFNGMEVRFRAANSNTGASTINVNGLGVKDIKKSDGSTDIVAGEISNAEDSVLRFDSANDCFVLGDLIQNATTSVKGKSLLSASIIISNNASDADHDIDISVGNFQFDDGTGEAFLGPVLTKKADALWAAGDGQGMLDTGTLAASTWYYVYAIYNPVGNLSDILLSQSVTSPTLPTGYTKKCRIRNAFIWTDTSANIKPFFHSQKNWRLNVTSYLDQILIDAVSQIGSAGSVSNAFPSVKIIANLQLYLETTSSGFSSFSVWGNTQAQPTGFAGNNVRSSTIATNNNHEIAGMGEVYASDGILSYQNFDSSGGVSAIQAHLLNLSEEN